MHDGKIRKKINNGYRWMASNDFFFFGALISDFILRKNFRFIFILFFKFISPRVHSVIVRINGISFV